MGPTDGQTDSKEVQLEEQPHLPHVVEGIGVQDKGKTSFASSSSNKLAGTSKRGGNRKTVSAKEYNLRNKPLISSPIHANSFTITSKADTAALTSMRVAATRSWLDQCEEEEIPPKHGTEYVLR